MSLLHYYGIVVINGTDRMHTHTHAWAGEERKATDLACGAVPARRTACSSVPPRWSLGGSGQISQPALKEESGGLKSEADLPPPNTYVKTMIV